MIFYSEILFRNKFFSTNVRTHNKVDAKLLARIINKPSKTEKLYDINPSSNTLRIDHSNVVFIDTLSYNTETATIILHPYKIITTSDDDLSQPIDFDLEGFTLTTNPTYTPTEMALLIKYYFFRATDDIRITKKLLNIIYPLLMYDPRLF